MLEVEKERELEEVASLKAFVQETINESRDEDDTKRLLREIERLRRDNLKLQDMLVAKSQESNTLGPVINQVKKFALKIGSDQSQTESASSSSNTSLDENAAAPRKGNKYVSTIS